ncbi:CHAT domain-containing protein [Spirulina sp. CCNP1310]|uniref:CHAT domain-containing protein n=1 Tax=Spirulina sp. CCNP1310 TaxID=3110249 RepID=UPI002B212CF5|nr:CHAT domain-containing protein [Spirulina sp. CCNP1310]MEA5417698.1 CHAT domain-containing protein [Spirulina sp. CCNP1310]
MNLRGFAGLGCCFWLLTLGNAYGQSITVAPDGTGTILDQHGQIWQIQGGSLSRDGQNLFHSFERFNLSAGEVAQFWSNPAIVNILGRVVGGDVSQINGLMQVVGSGANLYLLNPAGIIFGPNARLDVGGSFFATTGDRLGFGTGFFNATGPNDYAQLVGTPNHFSFLTDQPAAILNQGTLTAPGQVGLIAGSVLNTGAITAGQGLTLAAVGENHVRLSQGGMLLTVDLPAEAVARGFTPLELPGLLTGGMQLAGRIAAPQIDLIATGELTVADPRQVITADGLFGPRVTRWGSGPLGYTFIDSRVKDYHSLLYGGVAGTISQVIGRDQEGLEAIALALGAAAQPVAAVNLVAEGNQGHFLLGRTLVTANTVAQHQDTLSNWGANLAAGADILIYSCFTALGTVGEALLGAISQATGADVAGSTNITGDHATLGGDWVLEAQTGAIEALTPFNANVLEQYQGTLATYLVNPGDISNTGSGFTGGLTWAVQQANLNPDFDTIILATNSRYEFTTFFDTGGFSATGNSALPALTGSLEIQGNNATLARAATATNQFRILQIDGTVTLTNLTIEGGNSGNPGAGILNTNSGNTVLRNLAVQNNRSLNTAGGISNEGILTLQNSTVRNNTADSRAGGIDNRPGGTLTVINSEISGNESLVTFGGAGGGLSNYGTATVQNSIVSNNRSTGASGGGITNDGTINIIGTTVQGNISGNYGGGLFNRTNATLINSTVQQNATGNEGGGIGNFQNLTLVNSTVSGNVAPNYDGIASRFAVANTTLQDSTISGSTAFRDLRVFGDVQIWGSEFDLDGVGVSGTGNLQIAPLNPNQGMFIGGSQNNTPALDITSTELSLFNDGLNRITFGRSDSTAPLTITGATAVRDPLTLLSGQAVAINNTIQTQGNALTIQAGTTINATGTINTFSSGGGGAVTLTAPGEIAFRNVIAAGASGSGGAVTITSAGGSITTNGQGLMDTSSGTGNGGAVTLTAPQGIHTGAIFTESLTGQGGAVRLETAKMVRLTGTVSNSAFQGGNWSIATAGGAGGGTVLIRHGGKGMIPFIVGDSTINGSAGGITTGTGPEQTILPLNSYRFTHRQAGIEITPDIFPPNFATILAGSTPNTQAGVDLFDDLVNNIGDRLGTRTTFTEKGFNWDGEGGGDLGRLELELPRLDEAFAARFEEQFGSQLAARRGSNGEEEEESEGTSIASMRATLSRIHAQTGTNPALIYVFSYPHQLEVVVVTPENYLIRRVVPEANQVALQMEIGRFSRGVSNPRLLQSYRQPAQQLYDWLIRPIHADLKSLNIDTLLFTLDAGLRTIPLAALHDGENFLIEEFSLGQIPSLSLTNSSYQPLHQAPVVAMGASTFATHNPLPAVPLELALITQDGGATFHNEAFTFENLRNYSRNQDYQIVHLATHADFRDRPDQAYIQLWDRAIGFEELRQLQWYTDPQIELLVLSACRTALGSPEAELGFAGLAVGAGVKSALASLWYVSDLGSLSLMNEFYRHLRDPEVTIKAEALRRAQLSLLEGQKTIEGNALVLRSGGNRTTIPLPPTLTQTTNPDLNHPFYWSAFMMVGSPW